MSTRSIIVFTSKRKEEIELTKAGNVRISKNRIKSCIQDTHIYVHWDGYPSNRLRQIVNYMSLPQVRTYDITGNTEKTPSNPCFDVSLVSCRKNFLNG